MRLHFRKIMAMVLMVTTISTILPSFPQTSTVYAADIAKNNCGAAYASAPSWGPLPAGVEEKNGQGLKLNYKLYVLLGLIVYGEMSVGTNPFPANNTFKNSYQAGVGAPIEQNIGRFKSPDGKCGEYRFFGFDYNGNLYSNSRFPVDMGGSRALSEKKWIFQPWANLPGWYSLKPENGGVFGNRGYDATNQSHTFLANYIANSLGFQVERGIIPIDDGVVPLRENEPETSIPRTDPRAHVANFGTVHQAPSLNAPGSMMMFHKSSSAKSGIWYHTMELPKLSGLKQHVPITASIVPDPVEIKLENFRGMEYATVDLKVSGLLDDVIVSSELDKLSYYNRDDIDSWNFTVETNTTSNKDFTLTKTDAPFKDNLGKHTFSDVQIPMSKLIALGNGGQYGVRVTAEVVYRDNTKRSAVATAVIKVKGQVQELETDFTINSPISFTDKNAFVSSMVGYRDGTNRDVQQFDRYEITIFEPFSGTSTAYNSTKAAFSEVAAQNTLHNFIKSKFANQVLTGSGAEEKTFQIKQKIYKGSKSVEVTKTIYVLQLPFNLEDGEFTWTAPSGNTLIIKVDAKFLIPDPDLPNEWFDVVPYPASDATEGWEVRTVHVDGVSVNPDAFFAGNYVFGIGNHGLRKIEIEWQSEDGLTANVIDWTLVHDTKPRVSAQLSGLFKENRKATITNTSMNQIEPFVESVYPTTYEFTFVGNHSSLHKKTDTQWLKEFQASQPGKYSISLTGRNSLGRVSDPYVIDFTILPDEAPAVVLHPFDSEVARGESVRLSHSTDSVDGDYIQTRWVKLWYDSDNNGTFDQLVTTYTGSILTQITPPAGKLGAYKLEGYAEERTNEPYYPEFMPANAFKKTTFETYFAVNNYKPMTELYIERKIDVPNVDVYFMLDRAMSETKINWMNANEVANTNKLIDIGVNPVVDTWDMKTYTHGTSASTSRYYGTSFPASSISYSSNGYSGTLYRYDYSNAQYQEDRGSQKTRQVTTTESASFTASCTNTRYKQPDGSWSGSDSDCPSSWPINSNGYSGSIPRTGTTQTVDEETRKSWSASYSGTLTKTVTTTETYWESNWVWVDSYTGYYSGTIYKDVRQSYDNSFMRTISDKYVVYMADNTISQLSDLQMVMRFNEAKLVCVGGTGMQSQITCDHFIAAGSKTAEQLVNQVVEYISQISPPTERIYRLVNESITLQKGEADIEGDTIIARQTKLWQDMSWFGPGGFDNSEGPISGIAQSETGASWGSDRSSISFAKPGKYTLVRRIQDRPMTDTRFENYNYYSNESKVEIIIHRKPIADVYLDWDYDSSQGNYITDFEDLSYDKDHQYSHPAKGIVDRTMTLRHQGTGQLWYSIPSRLNSGTYTLTYAVKDVEGAWSDTLVRTFILDPAPPVQLDAKLRTVSSSFSLTSIPASESLLNYDIWTRYPYNVALKITFNTTTRNIPYYSGTKSGNDINWTNQTVTIPDTTPDGNYTFRLDATGTGSSQNAYKTWAVNVFTPINLQGDVTNASNNSISSIVTQDAFKLTATTTKYPSTVSVLMFKGTSYARTVNLTGSTSGSSKSWTANVAALGLNAVPTGNYVFEWTATTPAGKQERVQKTLAVVNNRPPTGSMQLPSNVFRNDTKSFTVTASDPDNDSLTIKVEARLNSGSYSTIQNITGVTSGSSRSFNYGPLSEGTYTFRLTVTDGKGGTHESTYTLVVKGLSITGAVSHTDEWENYRLVWNAANPTQQRAANVFWAGEAIIVTANLTNTGTSTTKPSTVTARIVQTTDSKTLTETNSTKVTYTGEILNVNHTETLADGNYTMRFTVAWSNGLTQTYDVPFIIRGNIYDVIVPQIRS
ncbi:Athe_2463 domain-containing protein [Paenibacillus sp. GXUN7292]|uniref:Athe_2463 domain-containing protein n=1 Tax=Paenibacillus sp. GXUN7292 TaxID=3422499 RepID=UPI003D7F0877